MAPSKSTRIIILLAIDSAFFLVELIVGEPAFPAKLDASTLAKLTGSQALPYTHWPLSQTPFIWSVILRPTYVPPHITFTDAKLY